MSNTKHYLGDGVYARAGSHGRIILTTENGIRETNSIGLEPEVFESLKYYIEFLSKNGAAVADLYYLGALEYFGDNDSRNTLELNEIFGEAAFDACKDKPK